MSVSSEGDNPLDNMQCLKDHDNSYDDTDKKLLTLLPSQVVVPRTVTGPAHPMNKGAIDWGHHGLLAYGCNSTVVVVDTKNVQILQTLDSRKSYIKKVLWVSGAESKADGSTSLHLVSGDSSGNIVYWDVTNDKIVSSMQDGNKSVLGMAWVPGLENELMLAALHSPYFLIIWDIKKQSKLWKKSFTDTLISFDFDPFSNSKIAFLCPDCILFVDDFQIGKIPSTNGRKFYISSPRLVAESGTDTDSTKGSRDRLKRLMRGMVLGETKPRGEESMTVSECVQLSYHRSLRDHLILLYPRDIILIDLHVNQTIGIVPIEKTLSPLVQVSGFFQQIVGCRQRDLIYCLHESGSVAVKIRRKHYLSTSPLDPHSNSENNSNNDFGSYCPEMLLCYEHKFQSEPVRQMKGSKILSIAVDPISESKLALTLSTGKVVFLELEQVSDVNDYSSFSSLSDIVPINGESSCSYRLVLGSMLSNISGTITVARMCPPLTARNKPHYLPLLAVGTSTGNLYVCNLSLGSITKEFTLHSTPVRGIEWTGPRSVITYAHGEGNKVRNEMFLTDLRTGYSLPIRADRHSEPPISIVRASPLRQYFVVILKDGPFELWELASVCLLRTMPKKFPIVIALEWSPIHSVKSMQTKRRQSKDEPDNKADAVKPALEHLVFSDNASQLYHFSVFEGNVRDGIKIPPETGVSVVTCLGFKANQIVQGDTEGVLNMWDLKARSSRNVPTSRGPIRYLRFAPGKQNLKLLVLYHDGIDIIDLKQNQYEKISEMKLGRDGAKIVDVDWASCDLPVIVTDDGWIRILDLKLNVTSSPMLDYNLPEPISCPYLLPQKSLNKIQFLLSTQFWRDSPKLHSFTITDGFTAVELNSVNKQVDLLEIETDKFATMNTAEKCLYTSKLLGDIYGIDFWTVAIYYLQVAAAVNKTNSLNNNTEEGSKDGQMSDLKRINKFPNIEPLDTCYDYLMDPFSYQRVELERVSGMEWKRGDYRHTQRVVERLVLLGEMDRAVQLLLDTDIDNPNYYTDAIKACLVATIQQTGAAQSTIKLVATNLIANGKVWEGVQLLCLIGKGLDGCRYLVSSGLWDSAVWLAKAILPPHETQHLMTKYADHLANSGDKFEAILVLISQCEFGKALEMLFSQHQILTAALLLISCKEFALPIPHEITVSIVTVLSEYMSTIGNTDAAQAFPGYFGIET